MRRRLVVPAIAAAAAFAAVPSVAQANHHACPQITTIPNANGTTTINVARKNCAPTYVPYPIGGPKSPVVTGANQTIPIHLPGIQTPLLPDLGRWGDITTPAFSDPLNDAGPDLSCVRPDLGRPVGGDPPIPSPGSAADPFPIEWVLRNGNVQLGDGRVIPTPQVCAPTAVRSDGSRVYLFIDANINTAGSLLEILTWIPGWPLGLSAQSQGDGHAHTH
jgi:hypothetical protein